MKTIVRRPGEMGPWAGALLAALIVVGAVAGAHALAQAPAPRAVIPLADMVSDLKALDAEIGGARVSALIDTGAGISFVGKSVVDAVGCKPFGQIAGVRQSGEVVRVPWCGFLNVSAGGVEGRDAVGFFDNADILPDGWSIVSLNVFKDGPITLDWPNHQLILESEASLAERTKDLVQSPLHIQREVGGIALDVFFEIKTSGEPLRILLDSGSGAGNILAPHAFTQLGLDVPEVVKDGQPVKPVSVDLTVAGRPMTGVEVHAEDIIYDGNFGARFLRDNVVTLDFASERIWIAPQ